MNNFVYATDLFRDVRKYRRDHGYKRSSVKPDTKIEMTEDEDQ